MKDKFANPHLPIIFESEVESEAGDSLCFGPRGDLQTLDHSGEALMFQSGIFALSVLSNNGEIDIVVTGRGSTNGFANNDGRVDVELLSHRHVPRVVPRSFEGGEQNT